MSTSLIVIDGALETEVLFWCSENPEHGSPLDIRSHLAVEIYLDSCKNASNCLAGILRQLRLEGHFILEEHLILFLEVKSVVVADKSQRTAVVPVDRLGSMGKIGNLELLGTFVGWFGLH